MSFTQGPALIGAEAVLASPPEGFPELSDRLYSVRVAPLSLVWSIPTRALLHVLPTDEEWRVVKTGACMELLSMISLRSIFQGPIALHKLLARVKRTFKGGRTGVLTTLSMRLPSRVNKKKNSE